MAGHVEERTCFWCRWHSWDHDRCILNGRIITGNEEACKSYTPSEEYEKYIEMGKTAD